MEKKIILSILIIATFILADNGNEVLAELNWLPEGLNWFQRGVLLQLLWYVILPFATLIFIFGNRSFFVETGLKAPIAPALRFALLCTLPMLLGYGIIAGFSFNFSLPAFLITCIVAAFGEEILYRGFLFGQLFKNASWGFLPATIISAFIFGYAHIYQGADWGQIAGIFLVTFLGGLWFSWLYVEWNFNLWVPIFFHFLMNFYWMVFSAGDTALGGLWANVFRAMTIFLSIYLTIRYKRKQGQPMSITRKTLWRNEPQAAQTEFAL